MDKLLEIGRRAIFVLRVISGYEERRIRSYRLQLQKQIEQAQERKAVVTKIPEQLILSEIRKMVEEMQMVNRKLEEAEASIEEYFKPFDKDVEMLMNMKLGKDEKKLETMVEDIQEQALSKNTAEKIAKTVSLDERNQVVEVQKATSKYVEDK
ncbi:hypothetical protein ZOSMA_7G00080 [Zostera marina]|uniref:Uncharacterized protein n=1 Tax=Zostera marina TaxID=29655 RepID=A0A0K9NMG5_ZOSMR|nr:hypothetical protein ZOSMA_7G00080 [Zostera marina]